MSSTLARRRASPFSALPCPASSPTPSRRQAGSLSPSPRCPAIPPPLRSNAPLLPLSRIGAVGDPRSATSCISGPRRLPCRSSSSFDHQTLVPTVGANCVNRTQKMSLSQEPQRPFLAFGNPFRMIRPRGSSKLNQNHALLNKFEEALAFRLRKLTPKLNESICSLSWMKLAMKLLSETHNDIKSLINDLKLPVCNWDENWIDVYLGNSVKLLDISTAFTSEISRLGQGQLLLQCHMHKLSHHSHKSQVSLDSWSLHIGSRNPRMENCSAVIDQLVQSLALPKMKNSAKGKVLMQAMYGVRVLSILLFSVFISVFRGSNAALVDLHVPQTHSWAEAYTDLQSSVNKEVRDLKSAGISIKELEAVDQSAKTLLKSVQEVDEAAESSTTMKDSISELQRRIERLTGGLDLLAKEVDGFFQIVFGSRNALLCNLRTRIVNSGGAAKGTVSPCMLNAKFTV